MIGVAVVAMAIDECVCVCGCLVIVTFPLRDDPTTALLAWTTTPWTLPSNLALCVNPDMDYVKVRELKTGRCFIVMETRIGYVFKTAAAIDVIDR